MNHRRVLLIACCTIMWLFLMIGAPASDGAERAPLGPVKRASSAIAITTDGVTLLVANPDSNSVTLVDTARDALERYVYDPYGKVERVPKNWALV